MSEKSIKERKSYLAFTAVGKARPCVPDCFCVVRFLRWPICYRPLYRDLSPDGRAFIRQLHEADNY